MMAEFALLKNRLATATSGECLPSYGSKLWTPPPYVRTAGEEDGRGLLEGGLDRGGTGVGR